MATAAPAAPAAAPQAPPEAAPVAARAIRPIPNKPTQKGLGLPNVGKPPMLPGVVDTLDADTGVALDAEPEPGQDLPVAPEQLADGLDQTPPEQLEEQPDGSWLKLDLGDGQVAKFRDEAHLAQNLKTLRGQFRSMQQNEVSANEKAYGWHQQATRYEAMLRTLGVDPETGAFSQPGSPQSASPSQVGPAAAQPQGELTQAEVEREITEAVDWKVLNNLLRQDPVQALAYQQMESAKVVSKLLAERIPALIEQKLAPLQEQADRARGMTAVSSFWSQARGARDQNGNPVFPELQTNEGLEQMGRVWTQLHQSGLPLEFLMTPEGIHTAALWYRQFKSQNGGAQTAQPAPPQNPTQQIAAQVRGAVEARAQAGQALAPGARSSLPSPTGRPADPRRAIAQAIMAAGPSQSLGVRFDD